MVEPELDDEDGQLSTILETQTGRVHSKWKGTPNLYFRIKEDSGHWWEIRVRDPKTSWDSAQKLFKRHTMDSWLGVLRDESQLGVYKGLKFRIIREDRVKVIKNLGRTLLDELVNLFRSYWTHRLGVSDGLLQVLGHIVKVKTQEVQGYQFQDPENHGIWTISLYSYVSNN